MAFSIVWDVRCRIATPRPAVSARSAGGCGELTLQEGISLFGLGTMTEFFMSICLASSGV